MKFRQSPRLKDFHYSGGYAYNLTFVTRGRNRFCSRADVVNLCLACLNGSASAAGFTVLAYCFMPDHLHLLVLGAEKSDLKEFARHFKQISGYRFKQRYGTSLWQTSYYDHVVRREESLEEIAACIWHNPVRAGLVARADGFPFSGPKQLLRDIVEGRSEDLQLLSEATANVKQTHRGGSP